MSVLRLEKVGYTYEDGPTVVLKDINFEFEEGKTYAIKGKSGSGKTTLLSLISGLEKCKEGKIFFKDKDLSKVDLDIYRSRHIGIVFQSFNLLPHMTAIENIILSMDISKVKTKNKYELAVKLLEKVGSNDTIGNRRILKLSGGEQQRVAIARSLSYDPEIILADEPTGNLDRETEDEIMQIFKNLAKMENKCIIIVSHSANIASSVDKIFELHSIKK